MPFISHNDITITLTHSAQDSEIFLKKYEKVMKYLIKHSKIYRFESKTDHIDGYDVFIINVKTSWAFNIERLMKYIGKLEDE